MKLRASRRGRDTDDIAKLLAELRISTTAHAEELFESFYPGEIIPEKGLQILADVFTAGLPVAPTPPKPPDLGAQADHVLKLAQLPVEHSPSTASRRIRFYRQRQERIAESRRRHSADSVLSPHQPA